MQYSMSCVELDFLVVNLSVPHPILSKLLSRCIALVVCIFCH